MERAHGACRTNGRHPAMNPPDLPGKTSVEPRRDGGQRAVPLPCSAYARAVTFLGMTQRLTPGTAALLVTAPLLWAGNAHRLHDPSPAMARAGH
eukprot:gene45020-56042_t